MQDTNALTGFSIDPHSVYDDDALRLGLRISQASIDDARRSGRLRSSRHGSRTLYLGVWVLAWLEQSAVSNTERAGGQS